MPLIIGYGIVGIAVIMMLIEYLLPRQKWPQVVSWWLRAFVLNLMQFFLAMLTGYGIDSFFSQYALIHLNYNGVWQIIIGYLAITFIYYWWHRLRHISLFWNLFHQMHHSPVRMEIMTTFYKHPLEILANTIISSAILYLLLGIDFTYGVIVILITAVAELFYHWNVQTPYWLGFLVQRPESHCIHHQRGKHHYNYSDLPIWDMLFGTFYNPKQSEFVCGFSKERELRVKEILLFKNVNSGAI